MGKIKHTHSKRERETERESESESESERERERVVDIWDWKEWRKRTESRQNKTMYESMLEGMLARREEREQ